MQATVLFEEVQHFRQKWLEGVMLVLNGGLILLYCFASFWNAHAGPQAAPGLLVSIIISGLITVLLKRLKLITQITTEGIQVRFSPLQGRFLVYQWSAIEQLYIRTYNPISEYGGWGIRLGPSGTAYNVSGTVGLQLVLRGGHKMLIGTNKPDLLIAALQAAGHF